MKLLDTKTIVESVRLVCSQWRRVSRHRSLWKKNVIFVRGSQNYKSELLYMRAASYVKYLFVVLTPKTSEWLRRSLVEYDFDGQVESLTIDLRYDYSSREPFSPRDYSLCVDLFRQFSQGLSSFEIRTESQTSFPKEDVRALLDSIEKAPLLKELLLQSHVVCSYGGPVELVNLSLEVLSVSGYHDTSSTVIVALVSASRSSLHRFEWSVHPCPDAVGAGYSSVMQQLALCTLLSQVSLPRCQDFSPIAKSQTISKLNLKCDLTPPLTSGFEHAPFDYAATCRYIRSLAASSVTELQVDLLYGTNAGGALLLEALQVLTQLRSLTIATFTISHHAIAMLRHLVNLEELDMGGMFPRSPQDVREITPDVLPRLRRLVLRDLYFDDESCTDVDNMLAQRPGLRIVGLKHYEAKWKKGVVCRCKTCRPVSDSEDYC